MNYIKDINLQENNYYNVVVEIPKGTNKKYELIEPTFDKVKCMRKVVGKYPFYYGCFPQTYVGDKDPLDMILLTNKKYKILDVVKVEIIGVIKTLDAGYVDDKVLVKPIDENIKNLDKLINQVLPFLKTYKGKNADTIIDETIYSSNTAKNIVNSGLIGYQDKLERKLKSQLKILF